MYFNDVHILYYVLIGTIGMIIGQLVAYSSNMFINEKKIFSKKNLVEYNKLVGPKYILIILTAISYMLLLYKFGLHTGINQNIDLIKFLILMPMLFVVLMVDYKKQIIPNRLNLTIFEIALVFVFIYEWTNINIAINMLFRNVSRRTESF